MNVREGDLAIEISSGVLVRVMRRTAFPFTRFGEWDVELLQHVEAKVVDQHGNDRFVLATGSPGEEAICPDRALRPLRDSDGEDEMLVLAGKPCEVHA